MSDADEIEHVKNRITHWKSMIEKWEMKLKEITGTNQEESVRKAKVYCHRMIDDARVNLCNHQMHLAQLNPYDRIDG